MSKGEVSDEAEAFDAMDALPEIKAMWLRLARYLAALSEGSDWIDSPKEAAIAMAWAAQAEACFWRATGDCDAPSVEMWVAELREPTTLTEQETHNDE